MWYECISFLKVFFLVCLSTPQNVFTFIVLYKMQWYNAYALLYTVLYLSILAAIPSKPRMNLTTPKSQLVYM